jgi:NAD(P)-dependent dehydrogenase (short-subunit alcohol dehydrogenase family)
VQPGESISSSEPIIENIDMSKTPATRVALVTGANRGIGLEVSRQLAEKGLRVVLAGRDGRGIDDAVRQLRGQKLDATGTVMDVSDETSVRAAARQIMTDVGGVDVLVNNAAVLIAENRDIMATTLDDFRKTFDTNVFGVHAVCQAFVPAMITQRYGRVVNVSSGAGQLSSMGTYAPAYSISKAALNALTIQLAAAVRGTGVLVNCVNPGWVRTRMGGSSAPRSVQDGADTIVWAATLPADGPTGGFFSDRRRTPW